MPGRLAAGSGLLDGGFSGIGLVRNRRRALVDGAFGKVLVSEPHHEPCSYFIAWPNPRVATRDQLHSVALHGECNQVAGADDVDD
jgi:hypothetical protein